MVLCFSPPRLQVLLQGIAACGHGVVQPSGKGIRHEFMAFDPNNDLARLPLPAMWFTAVAVRQGLYREPLFVIAATLPRR